jgi:hypothetical protein
MIRTTVVMCLASLRSRTVLFLFLFFFSPVKLTGFLKNGCSPHRERELVRLVRDLK